MTFLNFESKFLIHSDTNLENPRVRLCDIVENFQSVLVRDVHSQENTLQPNESQTILNNQRTLGAGISTTQFQITRPISTDAVARMSWTSIGGDPAFRTLRSLSVDATTVVSLVRSGPRTMRIQSTSGSPLVSTSVIPGDEIFFEKNYDTFTSPFASNITGRKFSVQAIGANSIDFIDEGTTIEQPNITLGSTFTQNFLVMSFPVNSIREGDEIKNKCANFNSFNQGTFKISLVTPSFIEFTNPYAVLETQTNTANSLFAYDDLIGFLYLVSSGSLTIYLDGALSGISISPLANSVSIFNGSISASKIEITNNSNNSINVRSQCATVIGC